MTTDQINQFIRKQVKLSQALSRFKSSKAVYHYVEVILKTYLKEFPSEKDREFVYNFVLIVLCSAIGYCNGETESELCDDLKRMLEKG